MQYSRRMIDRELSYFVPVGRPTLVHMTAVKGSAIAPKSRWAVPVGMYREQVIFGVHTPSVSSDPNLSLASNSEAE
jgi:hypothetical protein